jgi:hypothetical protein
MNVSLRRLNHFEWQCGFLQLTRILLRLIPSVEIYSINYLCTGRIQELVEIFAKLSFEVQT